MSMRGKQDFDRDFVARNLKATRERLKAGQQEIDKDPTGGAVQGLYYGIFDDALSAAGWATAMGEPETKVQKLLAEAARAAVELYRLRGTLEARITHLPENLDETFIDNSATNPWTHVQALYAALIAGQTEALEELAAVPAQANQSDQIEVSPVLEQYSQILPRVIRGETQSALPKLQALIAKSGKRRDPGERYWLAQASALEKIVEGDAAGFADALERLSKAIKEAYPGAERRNDPERLLALPLTGLAALARRSGVSAT